MAMKAGGYVGWEEVVVSGEKGRREVHYYLRDARGALDLAVVGRERSARHMSYAVQATFFRSCGPDSVARLPAAQASSSPSSCTSTVSSGSDTPSRSSPSPPSSFSSPASLSLKWRSRREVIDWLSSIVSGSSIDETLDDEHWDGKDMDNVGYYTLKGVSSEHMRLHLKEFLWLGSFWTCRKQRKHYSSFRRHGFTISVHDFVYVMAEDNKRLVAYVEDLYEDLKARKKVVVRWFHKVDEVNIILPRDVNDREIFFSLCLQDLSVECIDGLAAVLSAQHFEKYLNEVVQSPFKPFLCCRQVDNEDVKSFDITCLRGYWKQELLRCLNISTKPQLKSSSYIISTPNDDANDNLPCCKPKRKDRFVSENVNGSLRLKFRRVGDGIIAERLSQDCFPPAPLPPKKSPSEKIHQHLSAGCHVEVLSQDSGLRGCWFRCEIIKRHQAKVKVKYQDLRDADEQGNLEEWILASRVAVADKLGIRLQQRTMVRPRPPSDSTLSPVYRMGSVVDAWWNDGWWEGIVLSEEADQRFCVYFPGEQRTSTFGASDLRRSKDWSCSGWNAIGDRPDVVSSLLADIVVRGGHLKDTDSTTSQTLGPSEIEYSTMTNDEKIACKIRCRELSIGREGEVTPAFVLDGGLLARLKWSTSRKRCPRRFSRIHPNRRENDSNRSTGRCGSIEDASACMKMLVSPPLMPDNNCKFRGDIFFSDSTAMSSLVASR